MEIIFFALVIFGLYWYTKGSSLKKERDLRAALEVCFTEEEQYRITRQLHAANLKVPNPLPPLLSKNAE